MYRTKTGQFARRSTVRFTAYGVSDIPLAHADTKAEAIALGSERGRVVAVVKRLRAYPFTHLHTWTLS